MAQTEGIWAWDCKLKEMVLVIPSVLALLGDNPMQSELSCHIGLRGKLFCRVCWAKGEAADPESEDEGDEDNQSGISSASAVTSDSDSAFHQIAPPKPRKKKRASKNKKLETPEDMMERIKTFMKVR